MTWVHPALARFVPTALSDREALLLDELAKLSDAAAVFGYLNCQHPMYERFNLAIPRLRRCIRSANRAVRQMDPGRDW